MGKVRTELVKKIARELADNFPDEIAADFESNKKLTESLTNVSSRRLRNRIAGYLTRIATVKKGVQAYEPEEQNE